MAAPKMDAELVAAARAAGGTQYETPDRPCLKCGGLLRYCSTGGCIACHKRHGPARDLRKEYASIIADREARHEAERLRVCAEQRRISRQIITAPAACCGELLTAPRHTHRSIRSGTQKHCPHCRPDHLESVQPDAPCWLYLAEFDGRHGEVTGFGIAAEPERRWAQHRVNLRDEGMHIIGDVLTFGPMPRARAAWIEGLLKEQADGLPLEGFRTEAFRGHCAQSIRAAIDQLLTA